MNEMMTDIRAYEEAKVKIQVGEETIPSKVVYALLDGENPIRVWPEYRGLTQQQQVAEKAGVGKPYLSQMEEGKRNRSVDVWSRLAHALNIE